tara:strand:- start:718 stop:966 length:249 start_codon:yes stop_codon:yes gene_type:complete
MKQVSCLQLSGEVIQNPEYDFIALAHLFRVSATKNTKLTIRINEEIVGELYLLKGESEIVSKNSSETVTCPDSFCSKVKIAE